MVSRLWNVTLGQQLILKEHLVCQCVLITKWVFVFSSTGFRSSVRSFNPYLLHYTSALYKRSADGRSPSIRRFRPDALSPLSPQLRCLLLAVFCICTDLSRAAGYHGDHFLKNTGKEEGCQWCKVQEHREATGEKDVKPSKVQCFAAVCRTDFMNNSHSTYTSWYTC